LKAAPIPEVVKLHKEAVRISEEKKKAQKHGKF